MISASNLDLVRTEYLHRLAQGHDSLLHQIEEHIAARMGKMLRPRMLLAAAATLGDDAPNKRRTQLLAVAMEMLHNASLLHDDVIDHDDTRRGQPSANALWGNNVAVLAGDYLLAQTMTLLQEANDSEASRLVNATVREMVESELLQQQVRSGSIGLTPDLYLRIIDGKTASLFATAAAIGNPACRDYGLHYGRLFQLRDDLADHEDTPFTHDLIARERQALAKCPQLQDDELERYII